MRTWHTLESGYERMQMIVGVVLCLVLGTVCVGGAALLAYLWVLIWRSMQ